MKVTRDVILDLLPVYLAGEASQDSRELVEAHLAADPQLAKLAERAATQQRLEEVDVPLTVEDEMKAFQMTKLLMRQHNIFLPLALVFTFLWVAYLIADALTGALSIGGGVALFYVAAFFWIGFLNIMYQLNQRQ
jgi:anti-sigma factor RsiW